MEWLCSTLLEYKCVNAAVFEVSGVAQGWILSSLITDIMESMHPRQYTVRTPMLCAGTVLFPESPHNKPDMKSEESMCQVY